MSQQNRDDEAKIMSEVKGVLIGLGAGVLFLAGIVAFYSVIGKLWKP